MSVVNGRWMIDILFVSVIQSCGHAINEDWTMRTLFIRQGAPNSEGDPSLHKNVKVSVDFSKRG
jgi:hypothetical protein